MNQLIQKGQIVYYVSCEIIEAKITSINPDGTVILEDPCCDDIKDSFHIHTTMDRLHCDESTAEDSLDKMGQLLQQGK